MSFFKREKVKRNAMIILAVTSACIVAASSGNKHSVVEVSAENKNTNNVSMYTIPSSDKIFINGVVSPLESATYKHSSEHGIMENVKVQSGEYVDKGYHMFSYRDTAKEESVASKEKEIASIEEEIKELQTNSIDNRQQILYLSNKVKEIKSEIDELKSQVVTNVYAPFSGEIHIENTSTDSEKEELTIMLDSKEYYLDGEVNEQDYSKLNLNSSTDVYLYSTKEVKSGTISYISKRPKATVDEETRKSNLSKYEVKIKFADAKGLVNGYHGQAKIETLAKEIKIPVTAIKKEDDKYYVLVDEMGVAKKREIETSFAETDATAVVKSGLSENEMIVENIKESKIKDGDLLYSTGSSSVSFQN